MDEGRPAVEFRVTERVGDAVRVLLDGELTGQRASERLRDALEEHFVDDGVRAITLDAGGISFLDNFGVATLVGLRKESERRGKRLVVVGSDRQVRDKLRVTGVLRLLEGEEPPGPAGS